MQSQRLRLQQRLKSCSARKASKLGLGMSPACLTQLEKMINTGIERMEKQGAVEREEQVWYAEQTLIRYLGKLCEKAQTMGTFPQADDKVFDKTYKEQCPMWPYC